MWQSKYASVIPINLGLGFDVRPCSEGLCSPWYAVSPLSEILLSRLRLIIRPNFSQHKSTNFDVIYCLELSKGVACNLHGKVPTVPLQCISEKYAKLKA